MNIVLAAVLYHVMPAARALGLPPKLDLTLRLQGWREVGAGVRELLERHPGARLVGDDRRVLSELIYYARPRSLGALAWNPEGRITDHYRLVADVARSPQGPFVIVTGGDMRGPLARDFRGLVPLGTVEGGRCAECRRTLHVYFAEGFEGYRR